MIPASKMKLLRLALGLSQEKLAVLASSYQVRLSRVERGVGPPPSRTEAERIAAVLGVPSEELFPHGVGK